MADDQSSLLTTLFLKCNHVSLLIELIDSCHYSDHKVCIMTYENTNMKSYTEDGRRDRR